MTKKWAAFESQQKPQSFIFNLVLFLLLKLFQFRSLYSTDHRPLIEPLRYFLPQKPDEITPITSLQRQTETAPCWKFERPVFMWESEPVLDEAGQINTTPLTPLHTGFQCCPAHTLLINEAAPGVPTPQPSSRLTLASIYPLSSSLHLFPHSLCPQRHCRSRQSRE